MNCGHTVWSREHFHTPAEMRNCYVQDVFIFTILLHICTGFDFNLCGYFVTGGWCDTACRYEAQHAWRIPLCMHSGARGPKCCIPPDHRLVQGRDPPTTVSTTVAAILPQETETPEISCGRARSHSRVRRVIGGNRAPAGTWPWQAALRLYTGQYVCGGVIISDSWVLTAAHCVQPPHDDLNLLRVYVGDQTLSYGRHGRENSKTIRRIIRHDNFEQNVEFTVTDPQTGDTTVIRRHLHDIALIQLNDSLTFSDNLRSICLPDMSDDLSDLHDESACWVAGWGQNHGKEMIFFP
ncbi:transmembrane protease serine 2-like [Mercenaria mercenaria]|uniref:transmembrane protease serine 2-like n=1 Tax=Mercenaria mercenaria TaxID=6596 RepID=UPI00234E9934|nr:transmembrane protease serine 2-like [Mercenaria mercenaria]